VPGVSSVAVLPAPVFDGLPVFSGVPRPCRPVWGPRDEPGYAFGVRVSGHVVELRAQFFSGAKSVSAPRGVVSGFSSASRRRLFKRAAACDWQALGSSWFVTLTYPAAFPDSATAKRHLRAFRQAWSRKWGRPVGMWKLEFQRRGAPHFHLALVADASVVDVRDWCAQTWFRIVGSGDDRHLLAGTSVEALAGSPAAYFAGYVGDHAKSKEYQHVVPPGDWPGRFWGAWGLPSTWLESSLDRDQFVSLRRVLASYGRSRKRGVKGFRRVGRLQGGWQFVDGSAFDLLCGRPGGRSYLASLGVCLT
jgi:hypothetical protein